MRNPYMSFWLSAANSMAGHQRAAAVAIMHKQQAELVRQSVEIWTNAWLSYLPGGKR